MLGEAVSTRVVVVADFQECLDAGMLKIHLNFKKREHLDYACKNMRIWKAALKSAHLVFFFNFTRQKFSM